MPSESTLPSATPAGPRQFLTRWNSWGTLCGLVLLLTGARFMARNDVDADLWGHVQYGREWIAAGALPMTTTWSFVVQGYRWINHENFAELLSAWTADQFGPIGFTIGKFLFSLIVLGFMVWHNRRQQVGWIAIALFTLLAADNLSIHWQFRPQLLSYVCFAALIALLGWCFEGWESNWSPWPVQRLDVQQGPPFNTPRLKCLWLAIPLFVIWTNSHGGFAAGVCIFTAYISLRMVEAFLVWGIEATPRLKRLGMMIMAVFLATFLNPYGPRLHAWMFEAMITPQPEIGDWQPISLFEGRMAGVQMLLGLAILAILMARRPRDLTQLIILALTAWQAISHIRHICFFAILCGFWLPAYLDSRLRSLEAEFRASRYFVPFSSLGWLRTVATGVWLGLMCGQLYPQLAELPVPHRDYPVAAMDFMARHGLRGNTIVTFNWAQYAIGCFAADPAPNHSLVAIDGRYDTCYPMETLDIYLDFDLGPHANIRHRSPQSAAIDPARALRTAVPELALVHRKRWYGHEVLRSHSAEWVLLYQDSIAELWGQRHLFDDPASPRYFPPERRRFSNSAQTAAASWPALPEWKSSANERNL